MHAGIGTHIDAPVHHISGGKTVSELEIEKFFCPCVLINVTHKRSENLAISVEDLLDYETKYGKIKEGSFVIGYTGWQEFFHDSKAYRNEGDDKVMRYPGFSKEAAEFLVERQVAGIGIDTLSPDGCNIGCYPVHKAILGAGMYIIENLAHLDKMVESGGFVVALPPKIQDGSEAALRVVGIIKKN